MRGMIQRKNIFEREKKIELILYEYESRSVFFFFWRESRILTEFIIAKPTFELNFYGGFFRDIFFSSSFPSNFNILVVVVYTRFMHIKINLPSDVIHIAVYYKSC